MKIPYLYPILTLILIVSCKGNIPVKTPATEDVIVFKKPIMGWASWNNYRININEDIIKSQADAMVSKVLADVGYSSLLP